MAKQKTRKTAYTGYGEAGAQEVKDILSACYKAHMPVMLVGDPGVGKTALINDWCQKQGLGIPIVLIGATADPTDVTGIPQARQIEIKGKTKSVTEFGAPWWQVELLNGNRKVLFLDEFSNCPPEVASSYLKLIGDKVFADGTPIPDDVFIVMAMNPEDTAVDYNPISAPMANRICFISYKPMDYEVYEGLTGEWFSKEEQENWSENERKWRYRIVDFLKHTNGTYILKMNMQNLNSTDSSLPAWMHRESERSSAEREILTTTWASPRAWDNVARILAEVGFNKEITPLQERILAGTVGREAAVFFTDYVHQHAQIDPFELIKNPSKQNWDMTGGEGANYNDLLEIANMINAIVPKCDGLNGRPTLVDALEFYDKIIDLGAGAIFMTAFCQQPNGPGSYLKRNVPTDWKRQDWIKKFNAILIKFKTSNLIPENANK